MDRKKQQKVDVIADEILMLAKELKSIATAGTVRELEMEIADGCDRFQCASCATGGQNQAV